jgi:hypothetical protein
MPPTAHHIVPRSESSKRNSFLNFGSAETNVDNKPIISGEYNNVNIGVDPSKMGQETLMRKVGHEVGKVIEGGADLVTTPVKWIGHMQENW